MLRKTVDRQTIVQAANRMISHLAESGTKADADKREAIIAVVNSILMDGKSYAGYRYLNDPHYVDQPNGWRTQVYDETRIGFY